MGFSREHWRFLCVPVGTMNMHLYANDGRKAPMRVGTEFDRLRNAGAAALCSPPKRSPPTLLLLRAPAR